MKDYFVSVIVPVYNRAKGVHICLDALETQTYPVESYEILVVDDYSKDELEKEVAKHKRARYIMNTMEFGLPAARNMGIKEAKGDILIFLDDDAIVEKDYIEGIVEVYKENENTGGVTGRLKSVIIQDVKKGSLGKIMEVYAKIFGISGFFANQEGIGEVLDSGFITSNFHQQQEIMKVKWLSGCNMSYLKEAIDATGFFDNDYSGHAYFEDADFSYRVHEKGYELFATPYAVVDHLVTPVSREKLSHVKYYQLVNNNRFFLKNVYCGKKMRYLKHLIAHLSLFFPVLAYSIYEKNMDMIKSYLRAEKVVLTRFFRGMDK